MEDPGEGDVRDANCSSIQKGGREGRWRSQKAGRVQSALQMLRKISSN